MGIDSRAYSRWNSILMRCYCNSYHERFPTYKDCTVAKEWHNFQNFAKWFEENYIEGYHVDKDIKVKGNRVYGPDTCIFVTPQKNKEFSSSKHYKILDPEGNLVEFFNMSKFCRDNDLSVHNLCNVVAGRRKHHKGYTRYEEENNDDM